MREIADVAIYLIGLPDVLGIDIGAAIGGKLEKNRERFPVEVADPSLLRFQDQE